MIDMRIWPLIAAKALVRWIFADERERKILRYVPKTCQCCELLGICRDEQREWRCRAGCLAARNAPGSRAGKRGK